MIKVSPVRRGLLVLFGTTLALAGLNGGLSARAVSEALVNYEIDLSANQRASGLWEALAPIVTHRADFAGSEITPEGLQIDLTKRPNDRLQSAIRAAASASHYSSVPFSVKIERNSLVTLLGVQKQILSERVQMQKRFGFRVVGVGIDTPRNEVRIDAEEGPTTASRADIDRSVAAQFDGRVRVNTVATSAAAATYRKADESPWRGADYIYRAAGDYIYQCASWFSAYRPSTGNYYNLTAGHCGTGTWYQNGTQMGTVSASQRKCPGPNANADVEAMIVNGNRASIWSNPGPDARTVASVTTTTPSYHALIYVDGWHFDERVAVVTDSNYAQDYRSEDEPACGYIGGMVLFQTNGNYRICDDGDSGSPTYEGASDGTGNARAIGMLVACNSDRSDPYWGTVGIYITAQRTLDAFGYGVLQIRTNP